MPPDPEARRLAYEWLEKADRDLLAAGRMLQPAPLLDILAYHCQQAVEKALKGFLTWHGHAFQRTHDLTELLRLCRQVQPGFSQIASTATILTPYAVIFRYPGPATSLTSVEAADALRLAREAIAFVRGRLTERP